MPIFSLLTFTFPLALRLNFTYSFLAFRFPPSSVFFWFPLSAILFLKYKSVKSGEEVAERGRKIQSGMKNFYVLRYRSLFQNLPAVLDDDAAGVFSNAAAVVVVYQTRIYGLVDRTGFNARQDGRHVSEYV